MTKGARESWNVGVNRNNDEKEKEKEKNGDEERIPTLAPLSPSKRGDTVVGGLELDREVREERGEGWIE